MKPSVLWILVASSSYAEIYEVVKGEMSRVHLRHFTERREKMHDIVSDKPGHAYSRMGGGTGHLLGDEEALRHHDEDIFAHEIVEYCVKGEHEKKFDRLIIIASPHFLGQMRKVMKLKGHHLKIEQEFDKDIPEDLFEEKRVAYIKKLLNL